MPNAVTYAEQTLKVHSVYDEATSRLGEHKTASDQLVSCKGQIRTIRGQLADREAEVVSEQRGANPQMKITEFKEYLKHVLQEDSEMSRLRSDLAKAETNREQAEADVRHHELGIRAVTARMEELAGLLEFYGAAKRAQGVTT